MRRDIGVVVLAATLPLVAVVADPFGWYPFGPVKWIVVSALVPAGLALLWWRRPARVVPRSVLPVAALVAWFGLSALVGEDPVYAWIGTPERRLGVLTWLLIGLLFVAGQSLDADRGRAPLAWAVVTAGLGTGALATAEALGWEPALFAVTPGRLTATMGSAAYLGALTAVLLPALGGITLDKGSPRSRRVLAGVGAALTTVACLGSGARAAWLGLAVAAVVVVLARRRTLLARPGRALLGGAAIAAALAVITLSSPVGSRLSAATDPDAAGGRSRIDEWRVAATVIARHPLTGVGPEGYRIAFAEGVTDSYEQAYGRDPIPDRAHTAPLDIAVTGGLPALAAWVVVIGWMLGAAYQAIASAGRDELWLAGLGAAVIAHVAGQLLLFPTAELDPFVWLIGGLLVARRSSSTRAIALPRAAPVALGVVALVATYLGGRDVLADHHARTATELARRGDTPGAVGAASAAVAQRPDELRLRLLLAQALEADQRGTAPALAAVDEGLGISPGDPIAQRHRARLLVQRGASTHLPVDIDRARAYLADLLAHDHANAGLELLAGSAARLAADAPAAEASFRRAEVLAPRDPHPSIELSRLLLDTGRPEEALVAADRALARDPEDPEASDARRRAEASR